MKNTALLVGIILMSLSLSVQSALAGGGSITGKVFQDKDCDGIQDENEPLISGVAVDLLMVKMIGNNKVEIQVGWTSTGTDGTYSYSDLEPGKEYRVHFIPPQGISLSPKDQGADDSVDSDPFPQRQTTSIIMVEDGKTMENVDAGLCIDGKLNGYGNIMGVVFEDQNGNGIRESHEPLVKDIKVELYEQNPNGGQMIDSYMTNYNGEYMFSNIPAGKVIFINVIAPLGYNFTSMDMGSDDSMDSDIIPVFGRSQSIVLKAGQEIHDLDAGLVHTPTQQIEKDGDFGDWAGVNPLGWDPRDMTHPDDLADWENLWVTHYDQTLSISWSSYNAIQNSSAYNVFLDTNFSSSNGFEIGDLRAEYLIQGDAVYSYQGTGRNWVWSRIGSVDVAIMGMRAELCLPFDLIGNPFNIKFLLYGDNASERDGGMPDYLPDNRQGLIYQVRENLDNKPPVGIDKSAYTLKGVPVLIGFEGHDPEGFEVSFSLKSQPLNGWLGWEGKRVVYHPNDNFSGADSFTYVVSDGHLESDPATVWITVADIHPDACPSFPSSSLYIDGSLEDWSEIPALAYDPADINLMPFEVDWRQLKLAHDSQYLYMAVKHDTTPFNEACTWANSYFIDSDNSMDTGFVGPTGQYPVGAELMLQGAFLFRYTGSGMDWSWECIDAISHAGNGYCTEFKIDRWHIGFDASPIKVFLVGYNEAFMKNAEADYMPDMGMGSICYAFKSTVTRNSQDQSNEAGDTQVLRDYQLTILATKPIASNSGDLSTSALQVSLPIQVADGQTWIFQRSFDLVNWETVKLQQIQEKSTFILDSRADDNAEESFYRAVLLDGGSGQ